VNKNTWMLDLDEHPIDQTRKWIEALGQFTFSSLKKIGI